ncbi:MAG: ComEC/Rec2 family competence protein [Paludisphaera borealis]|uniref:ComEC/Rec2 family competence protein n=1 Tax=Paludisphaera borealis TaxID=1387353 RepID=UPI0028468076|nr:ComEC/Rec2 family competence protein [Paludisphaera borealis]MDR3620993.1 ComEC/Rec2 family competence protein [Paludisphaera borealis]
MAPLVPALGALAAGIAIDRHAEPCGTAGWIGASLALTALAFLALRRGLISSLALLAAIAAVGGGWHHANWTDLAPDDLAAGVTEAPRPAWVRGYIEEVLGARPYEGRRPGDEGRVRTRLTLQITGVSDGRAFQPASGRAGVTVLGDRTDLYAGQPIQAAGQLALIAGPLNPGEFDYRALLRARGIRLRLSVDEPSGVMPDLESRPAWWIGALGSLREGSRDRLIARLDDRAAPLASALILGQREEIDDELNDAFFRTGTMHLLAISGLQLQVLAVAIGIVLRSLGTPRRLLYAIVAVATFGYAVLVGFSPSVTRSAAMTLTFCLAAIFDRSTRPANTLATAGIVTLGLNPAFLFDVGCQLSFLAIAALFWLLPPARAAVTCLADSFRAWTIGPITPLDDVEELFRPRWAKLPREAVRWITNAILVSAVVSAAGLPLVALRFHMVSPIGVLLNIPLIPITSCALLLGALQLGVSLVSAQLAALIAWPVGWLLRLTESCVFWGADRPWGHVFVAGPSWASVAIFHVLLAIAAYVWSASPRPSEAKAGRAFRIVSLGSWVLVFAWCLPGWAFEGLGRRPKTLEGEILAVGHGLAVVLRTPEGKAFLYDCGRMDDPRVGRRIIAQALWSRGVTRLDAVFLSHADQDHFNALPDLIERFAIGEVIVPPGFAGEDNPAADLLIETLRERRIPVREVAAPAVWNVGATRFEVLHPPVDWHPETSDNARSLVLDVRSLGRRLLLTGDLDQLGLVELTARPKPEPPIDVMLSPHHGGRSANPAWLYEWAAPRVVAVSQKPPFPAASDALTPLEQKAIVLLRTWKTGAILLRWTAEGIVARGFVDEGEPARSRETRQDAGERPE